MAERPEDREINLAFPAEEVDRETNQFRENGVEWDEAEVMETWRRANLSEEWGD